MSAKWPASRVMQAVRNYPTPSVQLFASSPICIYLLPTFPQSKYSDFFSPWLPVKHSILVVLKTSVESTVIKLQFPIRYMMRSLSFDGTD